MLDSNVSRGTKVRCINDNWDLSRQPNLRECSFPRLGSIYTVRDCVETYSGDYGVRLLEIQNPVLNYTFGGPHEPCFGLNRFELVRE
jgi:hypothetical protein